MKGKIVATAKKKLNLVSRVQNGFPGLRGMWVKLFTWLGGIGWSYIVYKYQGSHPEKFDGYTWLGAVLLVGLAVLANVGYNQLNKQIDWMRFSALVGLGAIYASAVTIFISSAGSGPTGHALLGACIMVVFGALGLGNFLTTWRPFNRDIVNRDGQKYKVPVTPTPVPPSTPPV